MTEFRFCVTPSAVGDILIVSSDNGIVALRPFDGPLSLELESISSHLGALPVPEDSSDAVVRQIDEYLDGERREFDVTLDWSLVRGFHKRALDAVCDIPYGQTAGYGEVAIAAGSPRAARAVGTACANSPFSIVVPVHRVVHADGSIGGYGRSPEIKRFLLELEQSAGE